MSKVTLADNERFLRNAPAAIERRSGLFSEDLGISFEYLLLGGAPLVGMYYFGWSARDLLLFFLIGAWIGIVCDAFKAVVLRKATKRWFDERGDHLHVWAVANAIRKGEVQIPAEHHGDKFDPLVGVFIDFVFGGVGTGMMFAFLDDFDPKMFQETISDPGFRYSLLSLAGYQVFFMLYDILVHTVGFAKEGTVKVLCGLRGVGLFLMLFVMLITRDSMAKDGDLARRLMLIINGLLIFIGLLNAFGIWLMQGETKWLRNYLKERRQGGGNPNRDQAKHS